MNYFVPMEQLDLLNTKFKIKSSVFLIFALKKKKYDPIFIILEFQRLLRFGSDRKQNQDF